MSVGADSSPSRFRRILLRDVADVQRRQPINQAKSDAREISKAISAGLDLLNDEIQIF